MTLDDVRDEIAVHLEEISCLFKPGVKLTILCRCPYIPDGKADVLLTDDDLSAAVVAIEKLQAGRRSV